MAKEIHEQPEVVGHTLAHYLDMADERVRAAGELPFDFTQARAAVDLGLRHRLLCRAGRANTGSSASRACRSRSMSPPNSATARRRCARAISRSSSRSRARPPTRWPRCATRKEQKQHVLSVVNVPTSTIARESDVGAADAGRPGDRRRLDQGLHLPARGAGLPCGRGRPRARRAVARTTRSKLVRALDRGAAPDGGGARARAADRAAGARPRAKPRRALSRPRHQLIRSRSKAR